MGGVDEEEARTADSEKQLARQGGEIKHSLASSIRTSCFEFSVPFPSELFPFAGLWAASRPTHSVGEPSSTMDHDPPCVPTVIRISEGSAGRTGLPPDFGKVTVS